MNNNLIRKILVITLTLNALPFLAQAQEATAAEGKHIGLPIDWSSRHVVHSSVLDQEFEKAASKEPRMLFNYFLQKNAREAAQAGRLRGSQTRRATVQRDWNFTLGSGTVAPNMSPAKFGYSATATPDCSNDFAVYGLNVAGVSTGAGTAQPNLVGFKDLYAGSLGSAVAIATAAEVGSTVTITTSAAHGLLVGDSVTIQGVSQAGYNGTFVVTNVVGLTFTYTDPTIGLAAGAGGTSTKSGICGLTPSVKFAYNVSTASGAIMTSPIVSTDGLKIAFIESKVSSFAITAATEAGTTVTITAPGHTFSTGETVVITGVSAAGYNQTVTITGTAANSFTYTSLQSGLAASSGGTANVPKGGAIFHVLTVGTSGDNGSFTSPLYTVQAPGGGTPANSASMLSTSYSSSGVTRSSPYIDFGNDIAYFGDDGGVLYRTSCVFSCAAAPVVTALNTTVGPAVKFASPVVDSYNGQLFVGGSDGNLYTIVSPQTCTSPCTVTSVAVGSNTVNGGVIDAPIIDSTFHTVFSSAGKGSGTAAVEVAQFNYGLTSLGTTLSTGTQAYPLINGALNDEYYNNSIGSPNVTGAGYFCGPTGGSGQADLYTVTFTSGTNNIGATGASEIGTTVTITTTAPHGMTAANIGQQVKIAGVAVAGYNGTFTITAVPSTTTFQYTTSAGLTTPSGGGTVTKPLTTSNPPVLGTNNATAIAGANKATCSSFLTMTAGGVERLFFSQPNVPKNTCTGSGATTTEGCVLSYTINTSTGVATLGSTLSVLSGASGMIIDNSSSAGQASSLYFANQALVGDTAATRCTYTAGATAAFCAIKVTQSALQ